MPQVDRLITVLGRAQELYLELFTKWLGDVPPGARVILEAELRYSDGNVATEGLLSLPQRIDAVVLQPDHEPRSVSITSARSVWFEPFGTRWRGVPIAVNPFAWDGLQIQAFGISTESHLNPLKSWFQRWPTETPTAGGPFSSCVHFLSDPEWAGDGEAVFEVDLGSAPPEALTALLDAFAECGATRLTFGASSES